MWLGKVITHKIISTLVWKYLGTCHWDAKAFSMPDLMHDSSTQGTEGSFSSPSWQQSKGCPWQRKFKTIGKSTGWREQLVLAVSRAFHADHKGLTDRQEAEDKLWLPPMWLTLGYQHAPKMQQQSTSEKHPRKLRECRFAQALAGEGGPGCGTSAFPPDLTDRSRYNTSIKDIVFPSCGHFWCMDKTHLPRQTDNIGPFMYPAM